MQDVKNYIRSNFANRDGLRFLRFRGDCKLEGSMELRSSAKGEKIMKTKSVLWVIETRHAYYQAQLMPMHYSAAQTLY